MSTKMTAAAKAARRKYLREWQRNNPEKMRQYQIRFWTKKAKQAAQNEETVITAKVIENESIK